MTGEEHYREAEQLLVVAERRHDAAEQAVGRDPVKAQHLTGLALGSLGAAQVHATLAVAARPVSAS